MLILWRSFRRAFMATVLTFALSALAHTQTLTLSSLSPFAYPGNIFDIVITYTDSTPSSSVTGLQWTVSLPTGFTLGTPQIGAAASLAMDTVACNGLNCTCLSINTSAPVVIGTGTIATIPVTVASTVGVGSYPLPLTGLTATNTSGNAVTLNTSTIPFSFNIGVPGTLLWFTAIAEPINCKFYKLAKLPVGVSWTCSDASGFYSGSYNATSGATGNDSFTVEMVSTPTAQNSLATTLSCLISVNSTGVAQFMKGVSVQPYSAVYSCSGFSTTGTGAVTWP